MAAIWWRAGTVFSLLARMGRVRRRRVNVDDHVIKADSGGRDGLGGNDYRDRGRGGCAR